MSGKYYNSEFWVTFGITNLGQADGDGLKEGGHDEHGSEMDNNDRLNVLVVHIHSDQRDDEGGA